MNETFLDIKAAIDSPAQRSQVIGRDDVRGLADSAVQGYLAHKNTRTTIGP